MTIVKSAGDENICDAEHTGQAGDTSIKGQREG